MQSSFWMCLCSFYAAWFFFFFLAKKIVLSNSGQHFSLCRNKKVLKLKVRKSRNVLFYLTAVSNFRKV